MVIAVWNHDESGKSSVFITLLSTAAACMYPSCKVTIFENSLSDPTIGDMIFGNRYSHTVKEDTFYNSGRNAEETVAKIVSEKFGRKVRRNSLLEIIDNSLFYIPQYRDINREAFNYYFNYNLYNYIEIAEDWGDFTIISTEKSENISSPEIIDISKTVLVMMPLSQRRSLEFLDKYNSVRNKCFFVYLVPYYVPIDEVRKAVANLRISGTRLIILPCTENLEIQIRRGRVMDYVRKNISCTRQSEEYVLISKLRRAVQLIIGTNYAGVSYRIQEATSMLGKRDYNNNKYKRLVPDGSEMLDFENRQEETDTEE